MEGEKISLSNADCRLLDIVWQVEPIASPELCHLAQQRLGWKRTTTYTVLKRLCNKGFLKNVDATVTSIKSREEVQRVDGQQLLTRSFGGSLPQFVAAFLKPDSISDEEVQQLAQMIEDYRRNS